MINVRKITCLVALAAVLLLPLSACNTVEGLGQDAEAAGDAISTAASSNKTY
jgi:entericidin B